MTPCYSVTIAGCTYYPVYNNNAMFRIQDSFPPDYLDQINDNTSKASLELAFDVFRILCEEGEAVRVHYGYAPGSLPEREDMRLAWLPADAQRMRTAIFAALTIGYGQDFPDNEDVDLTLLDLQKKTESP